MWHAADELYGDGMTNIASDYIVNDLRIFDTERLKLSFHSENFASNLPLSDVRVKAGVAIADEILAYVRNDGWNSDGRAGGRENNPRPYEDYSGYKPAPHGDDGLVGPDPRRWVPLPETNGEGFFFVQKHVTPHIGSMARTYLVSEGELTSPARSTDVPRYNLTVEALDVVRRTASKLNDTEKMLIELADNKFKLVEAFLDPMAARNNWGIVEGVFFELASNTAIVDSLVLSWRDKVRNDHVRPTSVVHSLFGESDKAKCTFLLESCRFSSESWLTSTSFSQYVPRKPLI